MAVPVYQFVQGKTDTYKFIATVGTNDLLAFELDVPIPLEGCLDFNILEFSFIAKSLTRIEDMKEIYNGYISVLGFPVVFLEKEPLIAMLREFPEECK
ncbi:hypothetical protein EZS27_022945 [termite gut metagenome]|uniref:Uncharacterized protein n=1 Tax=termite gut metagenome TaxID=433724 RepID=A0A5J4R4Y6_9ZZZZ